MAYHRLPGESDDDFKTRGEAMDAGSAAGTDVLAPIWEPYKFLVPEPADGDVVAMAEVVKGALAGSTWKSGGPDADPVRLEVAKALAKILPVTGLAPKDPMPGAEEFVWSAARCIFAGFGFDAHSAVCRELSSLFHHFPWTSDESVAEWDKSLLEAHRNAGIPAHTVWLSWKALASLPMMPIDSFLPNWLLWKAWTHVLTHLRLEPTAEGLYLRILFNGTAARLLLPNSSNVFGHMTALKPNLLRVLGCPGGTTKDAIHPLTRAVDIVLGRLTTAMLPILETCAMLPPTVLAGSWSTVVPDPSRMTGFAQHGLRLDSVLEASAGVVREVPGDDQSVLDIAWNITDAHSPMMGASRDRFAASVPPRYSESWPSDLILEHFPNLNLRGYSNPLAARALLDLPLFAALIRDPLVSPEFELEYPLLCFMPTIATTDDSTNQGKTMLAETIARAIVPGVSTVKAKDSSSAPDQRTIAEMIRVWGTLCLDEWQPPTSKASTLSRDSLQSLCSGAKVLSGRAMENISNGVGLKQSLVFASKALDFGPDLVNRGLFWFLDNLTEKQRARAGALDEIRSGRLSVRIRLGVLALLETRGIWAEYKSLPRVSSGSFRFESHRTLAEALYRERCREAGVAPVPKAMDEAVVEMRAHHEAHTRSAEDSGLLTSLAEGKDISIRLSSLFHEFTGPDCQQMLDWVNARCGSRMLTKGKGPLLSRITPTQLLRAWMAARRMDADSSLSQVLKYIRGTDPHVSDRSVAVAVAREIKSLIPEGMGWSIPGSGGWKIGRMKDHERSIQLTLIHEPLAVAAVVVPGSAVTALSKTEMADLGEIPSPPVSDPRA
jgi:hypothetical protein